MRRFLEATFIIFFVHVCLAKEAAYKNWKVFQSNHGYEFKYPDCWDLGIDDPDTTGAIVGATDIRLFEKSCVTTRKYLNIENGVAFRASSVKLNPSERTKVIQSIERRVQAEVNNKNYLFYEKRDVPSSGVIVIYVEIASKLQNIIRWRADLVCSNKKVSITAATTKNPSPELLKKIMAGDLALSEPYKSIIESVRCI